jgi:glutamine synthetase
MRRVIDELGLELVRFSFADQHGVLHGKTLTRAAVPARCAPGVTAPSSLLLKDTSGRSVFPVFGADTGVGVDGLRRRRRRRARAGPDDVPGAAVGAADRLGAVRPALPGRLAGAVLHPRPAARPAGPARRAGYAMTVGVELEFHVFRGRRGPFAGRGRVGPGAPGRAPRSAGSAPARSCCTRRAWTASTTWCRRCSAGCTRSTCRCARWSWSSARTSWRSPCRRRTRRGRRTTSSSPARRSGSSARRHRLPRHLHVPAGRRETRRPAGTCTSRCATGVPARRSSTRSGELMSPTRAALPGRAAGARPAAAAFTTPTVNGYKRYRRSRWPRTGSAGAPTTRARWSGSWAAAGHRGVRLENRSGEPAANPYLYIASQVVSGLDGLRRKLDPGPPVDRPVHRRRAPLPGSLARRSTPWWPTRSSPKRSASEVVAWYARLKRDEFARYLAHVSDWEQREYFDLF